MQAVAVAIGLEEPELLGLGVALLAKFLTVREPNLKYLALENMVSQAPAGVKEGSGGCVCVGGGGSCISCAWPCMCGCVRVLCPCSVALHQPVSSQLQVRLAEVPAVVDTVARHQRTIIACLHDGDVSIRRRSLDLLFTM